MALETTTTYDPILKELYVDQRVRNLVYSQRPFFALVPKFEQAGGRNYPLPIVYGYGQGRSAVFSTAQTNTAADSNEQWTLTYTQNWGVVQVDALLAATAKTSPQTFLPVLQARTNSVLENLANDLGGDLFGDGFGNRAQVTGSTAGTTITLLNTSDVTRFEVGMVITASPNADGSSPRTGTNTITAIDRNAGTLTAATAWSTAITSFAANDYMFQQGDMSSSRLKVTGLAGWGPTSAPSSTSFFGVDRTIDSRLSFVRHTGTASSLEENLIDLSYKVAENGGMPDTVLMNYRRKASLIKQLGSKVQYIERKVGNIGFKAVLVHGAANTDLEVYADQFCQNDRFYEIELGQCVLVSAGMAPRIWADDGQQWLRTSSTAGMEMRATVIGAQFGVQCPGKCGVSTLT